MKRKRQSAKQEYKKKRLKKNKRKKERWETDCVENRKKRGATEKKQNDNEIESLYDKQKERNRE